MQDKSKLILSISALVVSISLAYYYFIYIPGKEDRDWARVQAEKKIMRDMLSSCLKKEENWFSEAISKSEKEGWDVPDSTIMDLREIVESRKEDCYGIYGEK